MSFVGSSRLWVREVIRGDHARLREVRLASLATDPDAFSAVRDEEAALPEQYWEEAATRSEEGTHQRSFVVLDTNGRWLGVAVVRLDESDPGSAVLNAMWVAPEIRHRRAAGLLSDACAAWAREHDARKLTLTVTVSNKQAQRAFAKAGFSPAGEAKSSVGGRELDQIVMWRPL